MNNEFDESEFSDLSSSALRTELEFLMRRARLINRELTSRMIGCPWEPVPFTSASTKSKRTNLNSNKRTKALPKAQTGIPMVDEMPIKVRRAFLVLLDYERNKL